MSDPQRIAYVKKYIEDGEYKSLMEAVFEVINNGYLIYEDIMSPQLVSLKGHRYERFSAKGTLSRENYKAMEYKSDIEFIEFVIIHYKDPKKYPAEVLFGWSHAASDGGRIVVVTSEPRVVNYYDGHYNYLIKHSKSLP